MVTIIDFKQRENSDGETFYALIVQGGIELVKSQETSMYYVTAKKASIPSTFTEEVCKSLIGQEIEGHLEQVDCEPYEVVDQDSGEVRTMDYRWIYMKDGKTVEDVIVEQLEEDPELV